MKLAVLLATSATLAATASLAQTPTVEAQLTPFADAMGMERGAVQRALDTVNVVEYTVNGTVAGAKVTGMKIGIDYVIPAIRTDVGTGAARKVEVASGALAWDESVPGVYSGPAATNAAERLRMLCLLPHGVILAALVQPQTVKFGTEGAFKTITSACPVGGEMKTTMNADLRPAKIELVQNGQTYTAEFTNYRHDEQGFEVFFPGRIRQSQAGKLTMDLTVTQGLPNPYMLFPVPSQVRPVASR